LLRESDAGVSQEKGRGPWRPRPGDQQAFQVLAAVDDALGADDAGRIDQHRMRQAADTEIDADDRRERERHVLQPVLGDHRLVRGPVPVAHQDDRHAAALAAGEGARDRQELLAHRAGRRDEQEELAAAVGALAADPHRAAGEVDHVEPRRRLADLDRGPGGQRAERCHALVQHADLAHQRCHGQRQDDDHDPQDDLGDD
jgi:hypothetical protein